MKVLLSLALLIVPSSVVGQTAEPSTIKVDVDLVNVLCTVSDKRGALVRDLGKEDFEIREDGRNREIRYFTRETDLPLTIAMLVDVSGSVRAVLDEERKAAGHFFETVLRPTDHALLLGFSSTLVLWQDFTTSGQRLKNALDQLHAIPFRGLPALGQAMPGTLLYDAVYQTARGKLDGVPGRKAMLIVSDGLDNGSQKHLEDAIQAVQATNTIVYGVCYDQKFSGCSFLKNITDATGGQTFEAGKKKTLDEIFRIIEDELRSQYSIGFAPVNATHDGKFRKLEVKVRRKGLRASVRRGYYAPGIPETSGGKK